MVSDLKKEKFIQDLNELDEVKEIKKMNVTNIVIYLVLILIIPVLFFIGFYFKINIICIISIIVLIVSLIYTYLNYLKCKKIFYNIINEKVTEFFRSKYGEIKLKEEEKEELCEKNNELLERNDAIEKMRSFVINNIIYTDHLIRLCKNKDYIDLFSYYDDTVSNRHHLEYCNLVLVTKIREDGVLCLKGINKNTISIKNRKIFEKCFENNEEGMKKTLEKIEKTKKTEKYIELDETQKQNLLEIYNKYSSRFTIVIKDGYIFLKSKILIRKYSYGLYDIFDVQNCLDELLTLLNV